MTLPAPRMPRTAVVTGAAGAFGSATSTALRERGVQVIGLDRAAGPDVVLADLTDTASVEAGLAEAVGRLGGQVDLLVHFAGIGPAVDVGAPPGPEVTEALEVNLLGAWRVTAAALPALTAAPGRARVVLVASLLANLSVPFAGAYSVSKRALTAYADSLRLEYADQLAVSTLLPGYVDTPIHARSRAAGVALDGLVPPERVEDIVAAVLRIAWSPRPPRQVAATRTGNATRLAAQHAPGLVERVVSAQTGKLLRSGRLSGAPLSDAMRARRTRAQEVSR
ncbi:MAG: SDR family NAD(P)-dependent oxidoreductase [Actinomycetota bacterium]|nr:SDR family NAD(P)-dependent oxidoreductase [Actinomycetota bacterium]